MHSLYMKIQIKSYKQVACFSGETQIVPYFADALSKFTKELTDPQEGHFECCPKKVFRHRLQKAKLKL